jgi:hypothetical protein
MSGSSEAATRPRKQATEGSGPKAAEPSGPAELIAMTINARTGEFVRLESVDSAGAHEELSAEKRAELARNGGSTTLEDLIEDAFEAGIGCLFASDAERSAAREPEEEAALRHFLLGELIRGTAARRFLQREILCLAMLGTAIRQAANPATPGAEAGRRGPEPAARREQPGHAPGRVA